MTAITASSPWIADQQLVVTNGDAFASTGISFEEALAATAPVDQRMFAFNELGMFGRQQAVDLGSNPAVSAPLQDGGDSARQGLGLDSLAPTHGPSNAAGAMTDATRGSDRSVAFYPAPTSAADQLGLNNAERNGASATAPAARTAVAGEDMVDAPFLEAAASDQATSEGTAPARLDQSAVPLTERAPLAQAALAPEGTGKPIQVLADGTFANAEVLPSDLGGEAQTSAAFAKSAASPAQVTQTQVTQTWLSLNIAGNLASLVLRDAEVAATGSTTLKTRIEEELAAHGLSLAQFTMNGAVAPVSSKKGG